jgi:hypothetical protein
MDDNIEHHCSGVKLMKVIFVPEVLKDVEKQVQMIRENLKIALSQKKIYADKRRELAFKIGDWVYLKVSPMRGT